MSKLLFALVVSLAVVGVVSPVSAADENLCLECHEPAEDWEGMSSAEILAVAMDQDIKMHKDNPELSEEQLKKIIATLLPDAD